MFEHTFTGTPMNGRTAKTRSISISLGNQRSVTILGKAMPMDGLI